MIQLNLHFVSKVRYNKENIEVETDSKKHHGTGENGRVDNDQSQNVNAEKETQFHRVVKV